MLHKFWKSTVYSMIRFWLYPNLLEDKFIIQIHCRLQSPVSLDSFELSLIRPFAEWGDISATQPDNSLLLIIMPTKSAFQHNSRCTTAEC